MHTRDITAVGFALIILLVLFFARWFGDAGLTALHAQNTSLFLAINDWARFGFVKILAVPITHVGDILTIGLGVILVAILAVWVRPLRLWAAAFFIAILLSGVSVLALKQLYDVNRPIAAKNLMVYYYSIDGWYKGATPVPVDLVNEEHKDRSFPSGHALASFALAGVLWHHRRTRWWAMLAATLIGLSRIIIGVHFPADVIVGASLGFLIGFLVMHWLQGAGVVAEKIKQYII